VFLSFGWLLLLVLRLGVVRGRVRYCRRLVPGALCRRSSRCSSTPPRYGGGPVPMTVPPWPASSTSCARGPLAAAADPAAGSWQPGHLPAAAARLAARRGVAAAPGAAGPARPPGSARLVAGQPGLARRARQAGWADRGRTRPTAAGPGPRTTCWQTVAASPGRRRPTPSTRCCWKRSWTRSQRSRVRAAGRGAPTRLHGDDGSDDPRHGGRCDHRDHARIARRGIQPSRRLGRHRYVVERSLAWLVGYRRLQVRPERRADVLLGFLRLACALACSRHWAGRGPEPAPWSVAGGCRRR
jgi:hypothetical protein